MVPGRTVCVNVYVHVSLRRRAVTDREGPAGPLLTHTGHGRGRDTKIRAYMYIQI